LKSVYLWGAPGSGKSFLMDLFYDSLDIKEKRRMHYGEFMLEIHKEEHKINKMLKGKSGDTITAVGNEFC
jgi:predicted ATPase